MVSRSLHCYIIVPLQSERDMNMSRLLKQTKKN